MTAIPPACTYQLLKYENISLVSSPKLSHPNTHTTQHHSPSPSGPPFDLASKELLPGMAENHQDCSDWSVCMHHQWLNILHITPVQTQQIFTEHQSSMWHLLLHEWLHLILTKALRSGPLVSHFWDGKTEVHRRWPDQFSYQLNPPPAS